MTAESNGTPSRTDRGDASIAGSSLILAGTTAILGIITAQSLSPDYSIRQDISDLGSTQPPDPIVHQPSATIFNGTMLVTGLLVLLAVYVLHRSTGRRVLTVPLAAFGVGIVGVGVFPGNVTPWHGLFALLTFASGGVTVLLSARVVARPFAAICVVSGGVSLLLLVSVFVYGLILRAPHPLAGLGSGGIERWVVYPLLCWVLAFGGYLLGTESGLDGSDRR
jgi:hypothetical membrane protein